MHKVSCVLEEELTMAGDALCSERAQKAVSTQAFLLSNTLSPLEEDLAPT
ncbi:MAG: hypothetical protein PHC51_07130 [bacterium]|nr:hypothetical protein [bacterium]